MDIVKGILAIVSTIGLLTSVTGMIAAMFYGADWGFVVNLIGVGIATICLVVLTVFATILLIDDIKIWKQEKRNNG